MCYFDTHMLLLLWITSENWSASILVTQIENQLIFDDNIIQICSLFHYWYWQSWLLIQRMLFQL